MNWGYEGEKRRSEVKCIKDPYTLFTIHIKATEILVKTNPKKEGHSTNQRLALDRIEADKNWKLYQHYQPIRDKHMSKLRPTQNCTIYNNFPPIRDT